MKRFIEKLIERLEENSYTIQLSGEISGSTKRSIELKNAISIVNQLAEEYINTSTDTSSDTSTTNADRIRSMTNEELAEFLDDLTDNCCRCAEHQNCGNCQIGLDAKTGFCDIKKWLQSEVEGVTENE